MPVQEFYNAKKKAKQEIDTLMLRLRQAYNAAEETTIGEDGYVNISSLEKAVERETFKQKLTEGIKGVVTQRFPGIDQNDEFLMSRLIFGYLGLELTKIENLVENAKDKISYDGFFKTIKERFGLGDALNRIMEEPLRALKATDAEEVIERTKTQNRIDPAKLEVPHMAELLSMYENLGTIPPKALPEDAPYLKKDRVTLE